MSPPLILLLLLVLCSFSLAAGTPDAPSEPPVPDPQKGTPNVGPGIWAGAPVPDPRTLRTLDHIYLSVGRLCLPGGPPPESEPPETAGGPSGLDREGLAAGLELLGPRWGRVARQWHSQFAPPPAIPSGLQQDDDGAAVTSFRVTSTRVSARPPPPPATLPRGVV